MIKIYAGQKFVVKVGENVVVKNGIRFIPVGLRKISLSKGKKVVYLLYGYYVENNKKAPAVVVIHKENDLSWKVQHAWVDCIDEVKFPEMWVILPDRVFRKSEIELSKEEMEEVYEEFKRITKKLVTVPA
jgi:hypothetical protein